jgi:hypothetical protein
MIDVVVLGIGRCGTSFTCDVLAEHFGVCFGHSPNIGKIWRGGMDYEDSRSKLALRKYLGGTLTRKQMLDVFDQHGPECKITGIKLLDLVKLTLPDLLALKPRLVIETHRPLESNIESLRRYSGKPREWCELYCARRTRMREALFRQLREASPPFPIMAISIQFRPEHHRYTDSDMVWVLEPVMLEIRGASELRASLDGDSTPTP